MSTEATVQIPAQAVKGETGADNTDVEREWSKTASIYEYGSAAN